MLSGKHKSGFHGVASDEHQVIESDSRPYSSIACIVARRWSRILCDDAANCLGVSIAIDARPWNVASARNVGGAVNSIGELGIAAKRHPQSRSPLPC